MRIVRQGLTRTQQKLLPVTTAMLERSQKRQLKNAPPVPQGCTLVPLGPVNVPRAVREARQRDKQGRLCAFLVLQGRLPITKTAVAPVLYVNLAVTATSLVQWSALSVRQVPTQTRTEPRHVASARLDSTPNLILLSVRSVNLGGTATLPGQQAATSVILALLLIIPRGELPAALYVLPVTLPPALVPHPVTPVQLGPPPTTLLEPLNVQSAHLDTSPRRPARLPAILAHQVPTLTHQGPHPVLSAQLEHPLLPPPQHRAHRALQGALPRLTLQLVPLVRLEPSLLLLGPLSVLLAQLGATTRPLEV